MNEKHYVSHPDPLEKFLKKPRSSFTRADILRFVETNDVRMINFRYAGGDGRLKTLNFVLQGRGHLVSLLSGGERVDGSSLFNFLEAGSSDLYVVPRFRSAFLNPFSEIPAVDILCSFYNSAGEPLPGAPEHVMRKAHRALADTTGYTLEVMAEIEYYVISEKKDVYRIEAQRGYHETAPFVKGESLRLDAMRAIVQCGGRVKYGHSEVGNFSDGTFDYEQNEIEFLPVNVEDAADQILIAKWILRETGSRYGATVSFAPKIGDGQAGSGMHVHMRLMRSGRNVTFENGEVSDAARSVIAGILDLAPALCAFGNTVPTSYFRLVPRQEAPTNVCWGKRNRSALIRVPLGWTGTGDMIAKANPLETPSEHDFNGKQTFELRSPDGSADIYLLIAGICVGARHGLAMPEGAAFARKTFIGVNIFEEKHRDKQKDLPQLPRSCKAAADALLEKAAVFEQQDVFTGDILKGTVRKLLAYEDEDLRERVSGDRKATMELVRRYFHCG